LEIDKESYKILNQKTLYKKVKEKSYNCKVAIWQLPYDSRFLNYDSDKSRWFEAINIKHDNEIENVEKELHISLSRYKTYTQTIKYNDNSVCETTKYPNGNTVKESKTENFVYTTIKDKSGQKIAEKYFNYSSREGRKIIYKNYTRDNNTFTVIRIFSYDTDKNRRTDIVNYGYTSDETKLTNGCMLQKECYLLNGKEVNAEKNDKYEYVIKDETGKKLIFRTE